MKLLQFPTCWPMNGLFVHWSRGWGVLSFSERLVYHVPITGSSWNLHETMRFWNACGMYNLRSKGLRSRSQGSFKVFVASTLWLRAYLTDLLYTWHKYSPWRDDVSRSISRSKGPRSWSHRSLEMKVTQVVWSFCHVHSLASSLFDRITSYLAYIQHMRGRCVEHQFLAATKQLYDWFSLSVCLSVCPSVCPSVTPFSPCSHHRIIMKFWRVITNDKSDVHAKAQGQRSRSQRSTPNLSVSGL